MDLDPDRFHGCLAGLATGDALGTTVEFSAPGTFQPVTDLVGGGVFGLEAGQWTDDTSMALCLAESLVERQVFDPADQMQRYVNWYRRGYLSSTGSCFDIGNATREALVHYERTGQAYAGSTDPRSAGNGSIMRLAPVAMFYARQPLQALHFAELSSRTTHGAAEAVGGCRLLAAILLAALHGRSKAEMLSPAVLDSWLPPGAGQPKQPLPGRLQEVLNGSYQELEPPDIQGSGYVVRSLEAALWAFSRTEDFRSGALLAVNLGDDADTTGAVYGQIAGAYYGYTGIPAAWRDRLVMSGLIQKLSLSLYTNGASDSL
ncbi:ADP-ribosylglycohydrolase family protein [Paenibacillus sp. JX-17]|uniref:ADP-ribosylglycohydrolase family protein n=1 Tax=Paenibacillus lacisoli TaxID=3064525 RepID=A0ABT9CEP4_9BACL|nr:ADP-ribosylglycohydrolase family protein [Paenibacillus sp. JX-17]MDO7907717.1 ADP-ribosylglycohydrolase family protein [Paenibacillus sp. JX-17]